MPLARFAAVLQRLAGEGVPLRAVRLIAESLIEHGQHERDVGALTDYARIALKSQIYHQYRDAEGLHAWLLTPETETLLREALLANRNLCSGDGHTRGWSCKAVSALRRAPKRVAVPLVAQDLRAPLRDLLRDEFNHVPVLASQRAVQQRPGQRPGPLRPRAGTTAGRGGCCLDRRRLLAASRAIARIRTHNEERGSLVGVPSINR